MRRLRIVALLAPALSFDAYRGLWADPAVRASIGLTLRLAALSTLLAAVFGVAAALAVRSLGSTRSFFARLLQVTLPLPRVVAETAMLLLLARSAFRRARRRQGGGAAVASPHPRRPGRPDRADHGRPPLVMALLS